MIQDGLFYPGQPPQPTTLEVVAREYTDGREQVVAASTVRLDVDD